MNEPVKQAQSNLKNSQYRKFMFSVKTDVIGIVITGPNAHFTSRLNWLKCKL